MKKMNSKKRGIIRVLHIAVLIAVLLTMIPNGIIVNAANETSTNLLAGLTPTEFFKRSELIMAVSKDGVRVSDTDTPKNPTQLIGTLLTDGETNSVYSDGVILKFSTSNAGERSYYVYDMGEKSVFNKLEIYAGHYANSTYSLRVDPDVTTLYYSDDGSTWTAASVVSVSEEERSVLPKQHLTINFNLISARYVKLEIGQGKDNAPGLSGGYGLSEISLSFDKTGISNLLLGTKAEDFYPLGSQVGTSNNNTAESMGTLLTDGVKDISYGEYKWYVGWIPAEQNPYVTYAFENVTELNTISIFGGSYSSATQFLDLVVANKVEIQYYNETNGWENVENISYSEERYTATPAQALTLSFDSIRASKIKISIGEGTGTKKAFRIMEIEAYNTIPEPTFYDVNDEIITSYAPGDTVVGKIKLGNREDVLSLMSVKDSNGILCNVGIAENIGNGFWEASVTIPSECENPYIEFYVWNNANLTPIYDRVVFYSPDLYSFTGRWEQASSSVYTSNFGGAYVETNFTGNTAKVYVGAENPKLFVTVDGTEKYYPNAAGTLDVSELIDTDKELHNIRLSSRYYTDVVEFKGFEFEEDAVVSKPENKPIIEFIGDSITAGFQASNSDSDKNSALLTYGYLCGEALQCDHTHIARPGIALTPGPTKYQARGMTELYQYTKWTDLSDLKWKMDTYIPDIIVINLGTNDANVNLMNTVPTDEEFTETYINFFTYLRGLYPDAEIFALRCFNGAFADATENAVTAMNEANDAKIHFVDTTDWINNDTGYVDTVHPNASGHRSAAERLQTILAEYVSK